MIATSPVGTYFAQREMGAVSLSINHWNVLWQESATAPVEFTQAFHGDHAEVDARALADYMNEGGV